MTARFTDVFEERLRAKGWRGTASPASLLDQWSGFVDECETGYASTIYEYETERGVRDLWAHVLEDPSLQGFPELAVLRDSVERVDERFRAVCRDDLVFRTHPDAPWWRRCVPRRAEDEFADDLERGAAITEPVARGG